MSVQWECGAPADSKPRGRRRAPRVSYGWRRLMCRIGLGFVIGAES